MIIEKIVAVAMATTVAMGRDAASGRPHSSKTGCSRFESAGSIV